MRFVYVVAKHLPNRSEVSNNVRMANQIAGMRASQNSTRSGVHLVDTFNKQKKKTVEI